MAEAKRERNRTPAITALNDGEWRIGAWDMELIVGDRYVARKIIKIVKWTYRASQNLNDKVNSGLGSYIKPEELSAWKDKFKQQVGELHVDERSLLYRFYKSSVWFTDIGLLYARWAEEA